MDDVEHKFYKFQKYELPSRWASALINGDDSGLEEDDLKLLNRFMHHMTTFYKTSECVDVEDDIWFSTYHDATSFGVLACDVALYTFRNEIRLDEDRNKDKD